MALTDTFTKQIKPTGKPAGDKHPDGGGMYLLVKAAGKYWRMDYAFQGKRKTLALGVYPTVTLAKARQGRDKAKMQLADGIDPSAAKKDDKRVKTLAGANTFELVAREFYKTMADRWSPGYGDKWLRGMTKDLFPYIGKLQIDSITAPMLLDVVRKAETRGAHETAHTLRQTAGQVFRYGIQTGRCTRDYSADLRGALKPAVVKHMAAILEPAQLGLLMRGIHDYTGQPTTRTALILSALLFQRPGNIRAMQWAWVDFDNAMLTVPSQDMKRTQSQKLNGRAHLVPLALQAMSALKELHPLTGHGRYVFPGLVTGEKPISNMTVNLALRRMGFDKDTMTAHGFRATARTIMVERLPGIADDVIEAQLGHGKTGPLGRAYDRAEYMEQRRAMMQLWADYLDKLRMGGEVIQFKVA